MDYRDELKGRMRGPRGWVASIPGFRGYQDKEVRREADKLLRQHLAAAFQEQRDRLSALQARLAATRRLGEVARLEMGIAKVTRLADRLRSASYGYAGWFDAVSVHADELDRLYEYDNALGAGADNLSRAVGGLLESLETGQPLENQIGALLGLLDELNLQLDKRNDTLCG